MAFATWWKGDSLPELTALPDFVAGQSKDMELLTRLTGLTREEIEGRAQGGHRIYVAFIAGEAAAYGWVATESADIGEVTIKFKLTPADRYLWDFKTLPAYRGRGIYPHLLQEIVRQESQNAERFWILYAPENRASGSGIRKAGFQIVNELSFTSDGKVRSYALMTSPRAQVGAALLGVVWYANSSEVALSPCWRCGGLAESASCLPEGSAQSACTC